jgi:predicted metal-dependent hydrolase
VRLPRTTWVPGVGPRPDDSWLKDVDEELLLEVGALLFERGQGFEAHEAWELAWKTAKSAGHAEEEKLLRALIKLAAAMVKVRQQNEAGVRDHLRGARALLEELLAGGSAEVHGVRVLPLSELAQRVERALEGGQLASRPVGEAMFGKISRRIGPAGSS